MKRKSEGRSSDAFAGIVTADRSSVTFSERLNMQDGQSARSRLIRSMNRFLTVQCAKLNRSVNNRRRSHMRVTANKLRKIIQSDIIVQKY